MSNVTDVVLEGFSLWDAFYFYAAAIGSCRIVVIAFIRFQRS